MHVRSKRFGSMISTCFVPPLGRWPAWSDFNPAYDGPQVEGLVSDKMANSYFSQLRLQSRPFFRFLGSLPSHRERWLRMMRGREKFMGFIEGIHTATEYLWMLMDNDELRWPVQWREWVEVGLLDDASRDARRSASRTRWDFAVTYRLAWRHHLICRVEQWAFWSDNCEIEILAYRCKPHGTCSCGCGKPRLWKVPQAYGGASGCGAFVLRKIRKPFHHESWRMLRCLSKTPQSVLQQLLLQQTLALEVWEFMFQNPFQLLCSCGSCAYGALKAGAVCPLDVEYMMSETSWPQSPREPDRRLDAAGLLATAEDADE